MRTEPSHPLFDYAESQRHAAVGIAVAAENNASLCVRAREIAVELCRRFGTVTMDDVQRELVARKICGIKDLGNAAGSVFRDRRFEFTGRRIKSARIHAHANEIKVWRLRS